MSIQSIERVSAILSLFSLERPWLGVSEIAKAMGLPKTTVSSLVRTLREVGFLSQDSETRRYTLGQKLLNMGIIVEDTLEINQKAQGPAKDLAEKTGLICRVAIWDEDAALVTLDVVPREVEVLARRIGPRVAAYATSQGRAILAFLPPNELQKYLIRIKFTAFTPFTITRKGELEKELAETRRRGYAVNNQELVQGRASIAVPIFQRGGRVAAAISLVGSPERIFSQSLMALVRNVQNVATEISRLMGYTPESPQIERVKMIGHYAGEVVRDLGRSRHRNSKFHSKEERR
jgi:DNA-binding IclR family transcriptional regulator